MQGDSIDILYKEELVKLKQSLGLKYDNDAVTQNPGKTGIFCSKLNLKNLKFRQKMQTILESNYFHVSVIILVLLDTMCVICELVIPENKNHDQSLSNSTKAINIENQGHINDNLISYILKYVGLTILGIFLVEIVIKLAFNTRAFLKSKLELFDSTIVIASFVLDIVFFDHSAHSAFELITLLRLWRIARIVNGTVVAFKTQEEIKREKLVNKIETLEQDNLRILAVLLKKDAIINESENK